MDECQHVWSGDDCCQHCIRCGIGKDIADYEAKIAELTAENGRLRAVLAWYADLAFDVGDYARKALGALAGEET